MTKSEERPTTIPQAEVERDHHHLEELEQKVRSLWDLVKAAKKGLPDETGDGTYIGNRPEHDHILRDISRLTLKDVFTIKDLIHESVTFDPIDDRTYFMENLIDVAARQPTASKMGKDITNGLLKTLWDDLKHPPPSYLSDMYKYRQADGSHNNIHYPKLGAAYTPYARTVQPETSLPFARPDPGLLFDCLMARPDNSFEEHPSKISSELFYLATIIIHDLFLTDHENQGISQTSSYLDLSPLYGNNQKEQDDMRTFLDGKLKPDCFSSKRVLGQPPGVGVMLIMFNRFHNDIAEKLPQINEGGRFTRPTTTDAAAMAKYDNDIFQTARLVTCGLYINCILKDYVRTILNLNRSESTWDLDPRSKQGKSLLGSPASEGVGNQVSAEFNLIYRWHSALSEHDVKWTEETFHQLVGDVNAAEISHIEVVQRLEKWEQAISEDPIKRPFAGLARSSDGKLPDDGLVPILKQGIEGVAGAFGANKVPKVLRSVEILGIMQSRRWNLATLNEFRAYFNLKKYEKFEEINPDPKVYKQLEHLYDHPDYVELYPGVVAEAAKKSRSASGLCPPYTVSRAILSDAVALVRGDRFYTTDYTPQNLTNWGFSEANYDVQIDQGHVMYKLILRAFPNHFEENSVYAHFPFVIPSENKKILKHLDYAKFYDFSEPKHNPPPQLLTSYDAAVKVLGDQTNFHVTWGNAVRFLTDHDGIDYGSDFMLAGDGPANKLSRERIGKCLYASDWAVETKRFFENATIDLLHSKSYKLAGHLNTVDIVRDVGNIVAARYAAAVFSLPTKTAEHPHRLFSEEELYLAMALAFSCIFYDADVQKSFGLKNTARKYALQIGQVMEATSTPAGKSPSLAHVIEKVERDGPLPVYGVHMIRSLVDQGYSVKEAVWRHMLPTCTGMCANQGQLFAQVLMFYLQPENAEHWSEICRLARLDNDEADKTIEKYYLEGARLASSTGLYRETMHDTTVHDGDKTLHLKKGDTVMVDLVTASRDPKVFPNPEQVDITRDMSTYVSYGWGPHVCLGFEISKLSLSTMLKTVARLGNLRPVPGPQGRAQTIRFPGGFKFYLFEDGATLWPFPASLKVHWDGDIPPRRPKMGTVDGASNAKPHGKN